MLWIRKAFMMYHDWREDKLSKRREAEMIARGGRIR